MALAAGLAATPAIAQDEPRGISNDASVRDVAMTPLTDLNLGNDPIPDLLLAARDAPYNDGGMSSCADVTRLVGELDVVLGTDYDMQIPEDSSISAGNIAQRVLGSFIPFRGIIREVSGANEHERDFREAIAAGMMRRAYLKGRGQSMGCDYPARPASAAQAAAWLAEQEARAAQEKAAEEAAEDHEHATEEATEDREDAAEHAAQEAAEDRQDAAEEAAEDRRERADREAERRERADPSSSQNR
ncbi:MAG: hypothetical protein ABIQ46_02735 [Alteraurantiacibacter sp.]